MDSLPISIALMLRIFCLFFWIAFTSIPTKGWTQEAVAKPAQIGPSGDAYLRAIPTRRINTDVIYYDPTSPAPKLETQQEPDTSPGTDDSSERTLDVNTALITGMILLVILFLFIRFGGRMSVSFRSEAENAERARRSNATGAMFGEIEPTALDKILRLKDRRTALILLAQNALTQAVTADGSMLQRSWTARDALRRVPADLGLKPALTDLVLASERVQFGDRDVSEDEFQSHFETIRPLLGEAAS